MRQFRLRNVAISDVTVLTDARVAEPGTLAV